MDEWGKWFRANSDKFLVIAWMAGILIFGWRYADADKARFIEGLINNLNGAFLTLVTGEIIRRQTSAITTSRDASTGDTQVAAIKETEK